MDLFFIIVYSLPILFTVLCVTYFFFNVSSLVRVAATLNDRCVKISSNE